jgi:hypothetical protein
MTRIHLAVMAVFMVLSCAAVTRAQESPLEHTEVEWMGTEEELQPLARKAPVVRGSHVTLEDRELQPPSANAILHLEVPYGSRVTIFRCVGVVQYQNHALPVAIPGHEQAQLLQYQPIGAPITATGRSRDRHVVFSIDSASPQNFEVRVELSDEFHESPAPWRRIVRLGPHERRHISILCDPQFLATEQTSKAEKAIEGGGVAPEKPRTAPEKTDKRRVNKPAVAEEVPPPTPAAEDELNPSVPKPEDRQTPNPAPKLP